MSKSYARLVPFLALALVFAVAPGCRTKKPPVQTDFQQDTGPADTGAPQDLTGSYPLDGIDITKLPFVTNPSLRTIYFDYDSDVLRPDAQTTLQQNYDIMRQDPRMIVLIEGHCDERGTQEYNIALGERRALAAREYMIRLGAPANRITTVSYGEERPAAMGSTESAWSQNRRGEFKSAMAP